MMALEASLEPLGSPKGWSYLAWEKNKYLETAKGQETRWLSYLKWDFISNLLFAY